MVQRGLFPVVNHQAAPALAVLADYPQSVRERFTRFHEQNPQVYVLFRDMAFRMLRTGRTRYSARTIVEVIRWNEDLRSTGEAFSVNDNFTPIYVRLLIGEHPEFAEFFELRTVRSKGRKSGEERARESTENGTS